MNNNRTGGGGGAAPADDASGSADLNTIAMIRLDFAATLRRME